MNITWLVQLNYSNKYMAISLNVIQIIKQVEKNISDTRCAFITMYAVLEIL